MKSGRTHWMDAVPVTLGQEFAGYAAQVRQGYDRVEGPSAARADPARGHGDRHGAQHASGVRGARARDPRRGDGAPDLRAGDPFEAQAARDGIVEASGALKTVAVSLTKVANDIRFLGSGPRAGLAEISSGAAEGELDHAGKVNPVMPEVVTQVAAQVIGNDTAITIGGMQGHFELNVFVPCSPATSSTR